MMVMIMIAINKHSITSTNMNCSFDQIRTKCYAAFKFKWMFFALFDCCFSISVSVSFGCLSCFEHSCAYQSLPLTHDACFAYCQFVNLWSVGICVFVLALFFLLSNLSISARISPLQSTLAHHIYWIFGWNKFTISDIWWCLLTFILKSSV